MRVAMWIVGCFWAAAWSGGIRAQTYDVIEMTATTAQRHYIDLNDSTHALAMERDQHPQEIVVENWSNGGRNYSELRPGQLPGATQTNAAAFNNAGQIVGTAYFDNYYGRPITQAFLYRDGQFTNLHASVGAGDENSRAVDITTDGTVLGGTDRRAFLYSQGTTTFIPFPEGDQIYSMHMNDRLQVAGTFLPPTPSGETPFAHFYLYDNGVFNDLGYRYRSPGQFGMKVNGINNLGEFIGWEGMGHGGECFIYSNDTRKYLAAAQCAVLDINDAGNAVGNAAFDPSLRNRPFIYYPERGRVELRTLIDPAYLAQNNLELISAFLINNKNEIIVTGRIGTGSPDRYYLLVPQQATSDTAYYNFEQPNQDWYNAGEQIASVGTSTVQKFAGASSLAVQFNGSGYVSIGAMYPPPLAGKTVTFHVYLPADATIEWVQPFVLEDYFGGWAWHGNWQPVSNLQLGAWNTITLEIPANATAGYRIGVELYTSQPYSGTVYIDSVGF